MTMVPIIAIIGITSFNIIPQPAKISIKKKKFFRVIFAWRKLIPKTDNFNSLKVQFVQWPKY